MDTLAAVNEILTRCGLGPVSSLDSAGRSDARLAQDVLDEVDLRIQGSPNGWAYNTRLDVLLSPDSSGYIQVPSGTIWIKSSYTDSWRKITQVGGKLYDRDNNTDVFTSDLYCTYALRLEFECIPYEVRQYITTAAAEDFITRHGDRLMGPRLAFMKQNQIQKALRTAKSDAKRWEALTGGHNVLQTAEAINALGNRRRYYGGGQ